MLKELKITNLALIEKLHITLPAGLVVLTGETGAGKSIILQSIHLLSGGRADTSWVRTGADAAEVEALFECDGRQHIMALLDDRGLPVDSDIIIKRIISRAGKSRFYINGSMTTAKVVAEIAENLLNVASQHDHQQLLQAKFHLDFIDAVGGLLSQRESLALLYDDYMEVRGRYRKLIEREKDKEQRRDFLSFQCKEIEDAALIPGEDDDLQREKERLKSSDDLKRLGRASYSLLNNNVVDKLAVIRKNLEQMTAFDEDIAALAEEISGHGFQLEENMLQLRDYLDNIASDPMRLDEITARIDLLQHLKRKYGPSLVDVIAHAETARAELAEISDMDELAAELEGKIARQEKKLRGAAAKLSAARKKVAGELAAAILAELKALCFDEASFEVHFGQPAEPGLENIGRTGWDSPEFMFSANKGEPVKAVAKVASGGELSRLLLAMKCILAQKDQVESVIFDEIDAGISGKTAEAVAAKIRELSGHHQVLCITHLPQIAAGADSHFVVTKQVDNQRTNTTIARLDETMKLQELARMLDGDSVTDNTMAYVTELAQRTK